MAIDLGTATIAVASQERTWRLEIFCEAGQIPSIRAHRETTKSGPDGIFLGRERGVSVNRSFETVAGQSFTIGSKTYTGAEIADVIAAVADIWRQEDIEASNPE